MVDVLFFAELQEAIGKEKLSFDAAGMTVNALKDKILSEQNLDQIDNAMIAINEEYAREDAILQKGDVVAFIPPVSGG